MHVKTYRELLQGLLHSAAFWDGMLVAKDALKVFPKDAEILDYNHELAQGFKDRHNALKEFGVKPKQIVKISRMGKIYQKPYPWMNGEAFKRTDEQREEFNQDLDQRTTLDIACVYPGKSRKSSYVSATDSLPLGIFALKNFEEGDMIMVDETIVNMSDVPSSKLQHCDACHASLIPPFMHPNEIIVPPCCGQVAFCSKICYQVASRGYHRVVCGKDIDWLYPNSAGHATSKKRSDTMGIPMTSIQTVAQTGSSMTTSSFRSVFSKPWASIYTRIKISTRKLSRLSTGVLRTMPTCLP
jgi:hypothetical protein